MSKIDEYLTPDEQEKFPKLTAWARHKITQLVNKLNDYKRLLEADNVPSPIYTEEGKKKRFIHKDAVLYFEAHGGEIQVYMREGILLVSGRTDIAILPAGGVNSVNIAIAARNDEKTGAQYLIGDKNLRGQ